MNSETNWATVSENIALLYRAVSSLEEMFPGRKFTPDGHLVGSIGEVVAAYMFDLTLLPSSVPKHDAETRDGRLVQIKFTQGTTVAFRDEPDFAVVLQKRPGGAMQVAYNGPGKTIWEACGRMQKNGARPISIAKASRLNAAVGSGHRIDQSQRSPI